MKGKKKEMGMRERGEEFLLSFPPFLSPPSLPLFLLSLSVSLFFSDAVVWEHSDISGSEPVEGTGRREKKEIAG